MRVMVAVNIHLLPRCTTATLVFFLQKCEDPIAYSSIQFHSQYPPRLQYSSALTTFYFAVPEADTSLKIGSETGRWK